MSAVGVTTELVRRRAPAPVRRRKFLIAVANLRGLKVTVGHDALTVSLWLGRDRRMVIAGPSREVA